MRRFALGYEYLCRIVLMLIVCQVAFIVHTIMGLVVGGFFPSIAALYAVMMVIYSFGRLPGMDVHVLEPIEKKPKRQ